MKLTNRTKATIEKDFRDRVERNGGKFIGTNWKKHTFHHLSPSGQKQTTSFDFKNERTR